MKHASRLICCLLLICCLALAGARSAAAQVEDFQRPIGQSDTVRFQTAVPFYSFANLWIAGSFLEEGLGYEGRYYSVGGMAPLWTDFAGGWWFADARAHYSERGRFFGNIGGGRRVHVEDLGLDAGLAVYYDYDDDRADEFGHHFQQIGVSGELLFERVSARLNLYFPIGPNNFRLGSDDPYGCFADHGIILTQGIDTALEGYDGEIGYRFDTEHRLEVFLGSYSYSSDLKESFAGFKARLEYEPTPGLDLLCQVNRDDDFGTTGMLAAEFRFGAPRGKSSSERGLNLVRRNDHIVRYHEDPVFAVNPETGGRWQVYHVRNNYAGTAPSDGTIERPFTELADAEAASATDEIIMVHYGDGSTLGMDVGITLKDRQLLFGEGVTHVIPIVPRAGVGPSFELCNLKDDLSRRPHITNTTPGPVVTLADDNEVAGFVIEDGIDGIAGTGVDSAVIRDNNIVRSTNDGINISGSTGTFEIRRNTISNATRNGMRIATTTGTFTVTDNTISDSGQDGANFFDANGTFTATGNTINDSGRDGAHFDLADGTFTFSFNTVNTAGRDGVHVEDSPVTLFTASGNTITGPGPGDGFRIRDSAGTFVIDGQNTITGWTGAGVFATASANTSYVFVRNNTIQGNGTGVHIESRGSAIVRTDIAGNEITYNTGNGVRLLSNGNSVSRLVAEGVVDNTIENNGAFGVNASVEGSGIMVADVFVNSITNNGAGGIVLIHDGAAANQPMFALVRGNYLPGNLGVDFEAQITPTASTGADLWVELSGNISTIDGYFLTNNRSVAPFPPELYLDSGGSPGNPADASVTAVGNVQATTTPGEVETNSNLYR